MAILSKIKELIPWRKKHEATEVLPPQWQDTEWPFGLLGQSPFDDLSAAPRG